jgi:hypothetical protein
VKNDGLEMTRLARPNNSVGYSFRSWKADCSEEDFHWNHLRFGEKGKESDSAQWNCVPNDRRDTNRSRRDELGIERNDRETVSMSSHTENRRGSLGVQTSSANALSSIFKE